MKKLLLLVALGATTAGGIAAAQTATPTAPSTAPHRAGADVNKDGVITRAEFLANAAGRFAAMDANGDGQIVEAERQALRDKMRGHRRHHRGGGDHMTAPAQPNG